MEKRIFVFPPEDQQKVNRVRSMFATVSPKNPFKANFLQELKRRFKATENAEEREEILAQAVRVIDDRDPEALLAYLCRDWVDINRSRECVQERYFPNHNLGGRAHTRLMKCAYDKINGKDDDLHLIKRVGLLMNAILGVQVMSAINEDGLE